MFEILWRRVGILVKHLMGCHVPARLGEDRLNAHISAVIFCGMIVDMDMPNVWDGSIDKRFDFCGDPVPLPDRQRAIDPYGQIDHQMRSKAVRL